MRNKKKIRNRKELVSKTNTGTRKPIEETMSLQKHLRKSSYYSLLKRVRKQLPKKYQRAFSHFIHAAGMDSGSDLAAHIIGRPLSILVGGLFALVGVCVGIYMSWTYGYSYNFMLLFLFFVLGYVIELLIESIVNIFVRSK